MDNREKEDELKYRVMQRVRFIHRTRKIIYPLVVESALMLSALLVSQFWVSFNQVSANVRTVALSLSFRSYLDFILSSVAHTDLAIQIILAVVAIVSGIMVVNVVSERNAFKFRVLRSID